MIPVKPNNVIWSDEQWRAIYEDGRNILVSAGAGSGKTAVLSKRVIEKLKNGVSLRNLIILTFTNAAAMEMKERIRKEIKKEIESGNRSLVKEYEYIDQSHIQTFDGFALEIVRKYHYIIGCDKNISICDKESLKVKEIEYINDIFKEHYDNNDEDFLKLIKYYSLRDDEVLKNTIISINDKLDYLAERDCFIESYEKEFFNDEFYKKVINEYLSSLIKIKDNIKNIISGLYKVCKSKEANDFLGKVKESLIGLYKASSYNEFKSLNIKMPNTPGKIDPEEKEIIKAEKELISSELKLIKELTEFESLENEITKIKDNNIFVLKILSLCEELNDKLSSYKKEYNLYSFMDIAKMAIKLLKDSDDIRNEMINETNEILVDEYQDTSDIQEALVSLISNNNVYMVGDVKQSIYRFRNANPKIFSEKYNLFKQESNNDLVIDLSKNFRSREEVLNNINLLFENVMNNEFGGADYNNGHRLIFGNKKYSDFKSHNSNFEVYTYDVSKDDVKLSTPEIEAMIIAKDIKKKIEEGYEVFNGEKLVPATFKDFAILTQTKTNFDVYKKVFEAYNIPLLTHKENVFSTSYEIVALVNCLKVISFLNNKDYCDDFKFSLASFLRSFIIEIDDNIFSEIFLSSNVMSELKNYLEDVYYKLYELCKYSKIESLRNLVLKLFEIFDVYGNIYKLENINEVEMRLNYFLNKASQLSSLGFTLDDFTKYFDSVKENDIEIKIEEKGKSLGDVVNMMTIHKSKGLEYNVCYFSNIDTLFSLPELKELIVFDKEYGVVLPYFEEGMKNNFLKILIKNKLKQEEISERIRLLYVALTRAKDKFIIVSKPYKESLGSLDYSEFRKSLYNSFYSIISSVRGKLFDYLNPIWFVENKEYKNKKVKEIGESDKVVNIKKLEIENEEDGSRSHASISIGNVIDKELKEKLEYGITIHKYLEVINYNNYEDDINKLEISEFIKNKLLSFYIKLKKFNFNILNIYHEYEFCYNNDKVLINGIIDMLLETDTEYIIIDYKLSDINKEGYLKQLNVYKNYIQSVSNKKVKLYLYSIIKEEFKEVF